MAQRSLTLLLSLPIPTADEAWPVLPALQILLSKGTRSALHGDLTDRLFAHFALQQAGDGDRPEAPLSALGDGLDANEGWWLRVDPVHMVADRDQLYLSASAVLGISAEEAEALVAELNRCYADEQWRFVAAAPQRWYLQLPRAIAMRTVATEAAMGSPVGEVLPRGEGALMWQRVMTEIQMLLHSSEVNARRSEQGVLTANSLWFWGGGELPAVEQEAGWDCVITNEPLARGLARLHGVATSAPEQVIDALPAGRLLWQVTVESPERAEQQCFAPLLDALRSGVLDELVIEVPARGCWRLDRRALRRWWRRRRPLASLLQESS